MNMVEATLARENGGLVAQVGSQRIGLGEETLGAHPALTSYEGRNVILGIRPEDLEDAALVSDRPSERLKGTVTLKEALGSEIMVHFTIEAKPALTEDVRELAEDMDAVAVQGLDDASAETTMVGRFGARSRVREGQPAEVAVDTRSLHFFDPETGLGIYDKPGTKEVTS
jgi:multiple sugar transport system ATP-binding protein